TLVLFMLWVLAALAILCSSRLSMLPTMIICFGVFLLGLMSDYFFGRPAHGGAFLTSGDILLWTPPNGSGKEFAAFRVESRGVRSLPPDSVSVRLSLSTGKSQPNHLDKNGHLVLGSAREGDSDDALRKDFRAGQQCIISFAAIRDELTPYYIARVLHEEKGRHANAADFIKALRIRGVDMEEGIFTDLKSGGRTPENLANDLAKEHKLTDIFPGNLAFWVYPEGEGGELAMKSGQGVSASDVSAVVEPGA
ncbi:uncharacterized protein METZ01_LOCUS462083, partial [marine metagenome]